MAVSKSITPVMETKAKLDAHQWFHESGVRARYSAGQAGLHKFLKYAKDLLEQERAAFETTAAASDVEIIVEKVGFQSSLIRV